MNLLSLVASLLIFLSTIHPLFADLHQSYEIFQTDDSVKVRGQVDLKIHHASRSADSAILFAIQALDGRRGEIVVHPGRYILSQPIRLANGISFRGKGNGTVFILSRNHATGTAFVAKDKSNVSIADIAIQPEAEAANAQIGFAFDHCGNCLIEDVLVVGMQQHGIVLSNNSFLCEIRGGKIAGAGVSGILLKDLARGGRGGDYVPNLVSNCIIYGGKKGIVCDNALVVNLIGCEIYQTRSYGFHIQNGSNSILLSGSRTYQISSDAVVVENSHEINISSNIFCWHTGHGLVLSGVYWGTITGNNIIDSGSINLFDPAEDSLIVTGDRPFVKSPKEGQPVPHYTGVLLKSETKGLTISSNAIFSWPVVPAMKYGIEEDSTCANNLITSNNINYCQQGDILSQGKGTEVASNVSHIEEPYYGKPSTQYQYYDTRLLDLFLEELAGAR